MQLKDRYRCLVIIYECAITCNSSDRTRFKFTPAITIPANGVSERQKSKKPEGRFVFMERPLLHLISQAALTLRSGRFPGIMRRTPWNTWLFGSDILKSGQKSWRFRADKGGSVVPNPATTEPPFSLLFDTSRRTEYPFYLQICGPNHLSADAENRIRSGAKFVCQGVPPCWKTRVSCHNL